jgi:hypothetical protein
MRVKWAFDVRRHAWSVSHMWDPPRTFLSLIFFWESSCLLADVDPWAFSFFFCLFDYISRSLRMRGESLDTSWVCLHTHTHTHIRRVHVYSSAAGMTSFSYAFGDYGCLRRHWLTLLSSSFFLLVEYSSFSVSLWEFILFLQKKSVTAKLYFLQKHSQFTSFMFLFPILLDGGC